ncbi:sigma-70 family RNA polymerase sigma factor [Isoptericola halotolerans]|uniref:RNA polymerase sigma factor n=1 Tax=Isoptericola halotolerans TaxID=300560 RepID=UPI00388D5BEA
MVEQGDSELLGEIRDGARWAASQLYERHRPAGLRLVRRISRSFDPEDALHDAWAKILHAIHAGAGPREEFTPYYYSAIRSVVFTRAAREVRKIAAEQAAAQEEVVVPRDATEGFVVREAFESLPERHRIALWAAEVEDLPRQQIGELLGIDDGAVSALLYRARAGLRREWRFLTSERDPTWQERAP